MLIALLTIVYNPAVPAQDATAIIRQMDGKMRGEAAYTEMTMTTVRPRYTRDISMKSWSLGDEYSLVLITAPARDNGTSFLKRKNEMWNYVPSIDKTVKMPPSMMSQSWMGSDFTNDDLVRGISIVDDYTHSYKGAEVYETRQCHVVELTPKPDTPVVYDKVVYWIDQEFVLPVKVLNYDERGELANTMFFRDIKEMGGRMIPAVIELIPENKQGHKTIVLTTRADYNVTLSQDFFSIQNLTTVK
ncbi:MAG: outer membrane lipoprotein-sorting protein [Bacteroidales bacterium]|nr:outer membrane lipoprotein-sorting protein [Bacteroidales bacterium]